MGTTPRRDDPLDDDVLPNVASPTKYEFTATDERFMQFAIEEAEVALHAGETPVGCVVVDRSEQVIARGHNLTNASRNGTRHAEFVAIDQILEAEQEAGREADFSGLTLYVSCTCSPRR